MNLDETKRIRWNGASPFIEVWFTNMNQVNSGASFCIRYAVLASRGARPTAQVWFISSVPGLSDANVAVVREYPGSQLQAIDDPFSLRVGPCLIESGRMTGMIEADGKPVTWDLVFEAVTDPLRVLPEAYYQSRWVRTKLWMPHPFMLVGGKIQISDHTFILNHDPGEQGHLWGAGLPREWTWFHCSSFFKEGGDLHPGYVTGLVAQPSIFGRLNLPAQSFGHLVWQDRHYPIRPASGWQARRGDRWEWTGEADRREISVTVQIPWKEMVVSDVGPGAPDRYCCHTDRASCTLQFQIPRQPPEIYRSNGMAHVEVGSREPFPLSARRVKIQK